MTGWLQPAGDYRVYLRGGPELSGPRLSLPPAAGGVDVQVTAADGTAARFRISGDFELVDGRPRRVFEYVDDRTAD